MTIMQTELYYDRMHAALGDKSRMLEYLRRGRVLDVGCGDGLLLDAIAARGNEVYGLDATTTSVEHCARAGHVVRQAMAADTAKIFGSAYFDSILCSAVLHEVYSYGDAAHGPLSHTALMDTFDSLHAALKPGGRLIIRDGVQPSYPGVQRIHFSPQAAAEGMRLAELYLDAIPFRGTGERQVELVAISDSVLEGSAASVMEFLYTYTWGEAAFPRETQELYGLYSIEDYEEQLADSGFNVIAAHTYLQPGYPQHLVDRVVVTDTHDTVMPLPDSNLLLVAEKSLVKPIFMTI